MQYLGKRFSVAMDLGEKGRANWERIFGKKKCAKESTRQHDWKGSAAEPLTVRCTACGDSAVFKRISGEVMRVKKPRDFYCQAKPKKAAK